MVRKLEKLTVSHNGYLRVVDVDRGTVSDVMVILFHWIPFSYTRLLVLGARPHRVRVCTNMRTLHFHVAFHASVILKTQL